ncbi:hypothetical protein O181_081051 [Austropuccinia psidii MF-1]|uniref:Integrase catalytic domain-containing protein n=1 Tax=Austropuccinia psidii MF-1 TaxID=1389203 RepID=A0A9Q3FJE2_9BASI|nr:hypothetical protein [Austropuccinia psidii MF-1]
MKYCKDLSLSSKLDEVWKKAYDKRRLHLRDGIYYHRNKQKWVMNLTDRTLINNILHECHCSALSGHLSEDKTLERLKTCPWWPNLRKYFAEYCQTNERCQKGNRATGKKFVTIIQIQQQKSPWEIVHIDWLTAVSPGGDRSFNAFLVLIDRYSKAPMFLPFHEDDTAIETAIKIWNILISHTGLFQNIISNREPKFTSALLSNIHSLFGTKLPFLTAYCPQNYGLAEIMIQASEDIIKRLCAYGL